MRKIFFVGVEHLLSFFLSFFLFYTKCARNGYSLLECGVR